MKKVRLEKLKEQNYRCEICGNPAKEIHHLDRTKTNHTKENIIVVCHKCHMKEFHSGIPHGKRHKYPTWRDKVGIYGYPWKDKMGKILVG
jgi:ribosomal protein S27AE